MNPWTEARVEALRLDAAREFPKDTWLASYEEKKYDTDAWATQLELSGKFKTVCPFLLLVPNAGAGATAVIQKYDTKLNTREEAHTVAKDLAKLSKALSEYEFSFLKSTVFTYRKEKRVSARVLFPPDIRYAPEKSSSNHSNRLAELIRKFQLLDEDELEETSKVFAVGEMEGLEMFSSEADEVTITCAKQTLGDSRGYDGKWARACALQKYASLFLLTKRHFCVFSKKLPSLREHIEAQAKWQENEIRNLFRKVAQKVLEFNQKGFVHLNLTTETICVSKGEPVLTGYQICLPINRDVAIRDILCPYDTSPPEVLFEVKETTEEMKSKRASGSTRVLVDSKMDTWGLGLVLFDMCSPLLDPELVSKIKSKSSVERTTPTRNALEGFEFAARLFGACSAFRPRERDTVDRLLFRVDNLGISLPNPFGKFFGAVSSKVSSAVAAHQAIAFSEMGTYVAGLEKLQGVDWVEQLKVSLLSHVLNPVVQVIKRGDSYDAYAPPAPAVQGNARPISAMVIAKEIEAGILPRNVNLSSPPLWFIGSEPRLMRLERTAVTFNREEDVFFALKFPYQVIRTEKFVPRGIERVNVKGLGELQSLGRDVWVKAEEVTVKFIPEARFTHFQMELDVLLSLKRLKNMIRAENGVYYSMEDLGRTLLDYVRSFPKISGQDLQAIYLECRAQLYAIHGLGLMHQSVTPEHVMVNSQQKGSLCGFGTLRKTRKSKENDFWMLLYAFASSLASKLRKALPSPELEKGQEVLSSVKMLGIGEEAWGFLPLEMESFLSPPKKKVRT